MRTKLYPIFLHVALIVLAGATLGLTKQNRALLATLNPEPARLEIGERVTPTTLRDLAGNIDTWRWKEGSSDRLLFVFTTQCPACKQNLEAWRALHERVAAQVDVVGVSLDSLEATADYRDEHALAFDVVIADDREAFVNGYQVFSVPTTLLISHSGRVEGVWVGALSPAEQTKIAAYTRQGRPSG